MDSYTLQQETPTRSVRHSIQGTVEGTLAVVGLLRFSDSFSYFPGPVQSSIYLFISFLVICFLILRLKRTLNVLKRGALLFVVYATIFISFTWSILPSASLYNSLDLLQPTLFGLYLSTRFKLIEIVKMLCLALSIGALLSILVTVAVPSVGIHPGPPAGTWRGIYHHKNHFASTMSIFFLSSFLLSLRSNAMLLIPRLQSAVAMALVLFSNSRTALISNILVILFLLFYRNFKLKGRVTVLFLSLLLLVLLPISAFLLFNWQGLVIGIGKDPTLTGRTYIWDFAIEQIQTRPLLGFGYSVFWSPDAPFSEKFASAESWVSPNGHNQLIDLLLGIGFLGTFFFLANLVKVLFLSLRAAYKTTDAIYLWPLGILCLFTLNNIAESYLFSGLAWVLYVYLTFSICTTGVRQSA